MLHLFDPAIVPLVVFFMRVANNAVGTIRIVAMSRGYRAWGFALASLESLMFAYTAGIVITDLDNAPNLVAYMLGFAVGGYVGMAVEGRFLRSFYIVDITATSDVAHEIAEVLREKGHGVTEMYGEGASGQVHQLRVVCHQRETHKVIRTARAIKKDLFVTVEESRLIEGGWIFGQQQQHER